MKNLYILEEKKVCCSKSFKQLFLLLMVLVCLSCKKKPEDLGDKPIDPPKQSIQTPKGEPVGDITQKTIGASGGSIELSGEFGLVIPEGAVDKDVNFSVQEVTHTLPYGKMSKTYRFLPEGVEFKKPVKLTIHYSGSSEDNPETFKLAYQDKTGHWFVPKNSAINESSGTISVETKHFSNWTVIATMEIRVAVNQIEQGAQTAVEVLSRLLVESENADDLLTPENELVNLKDATITWRETSVGPESAGTFADPNAFETVFTAPSKVYGKRRKKCEIEAVVKTKKDGQVTLRSKIMVLSDEFCYGKISWRSIYEAYDVFPTPTETGGISVIFDAGFGDRFHFSTSDASRVTPFEKAGVAIIQPYVRYDIRYYNCGSKEVTETDGDITVVARKNGYIEAIAKGEISRRDLTGTCYTAPEPFEFHFRYKSQYGIKPH